MSEEGSKAQVERPQLGIGSFLKLPPSEQERQQQLQQQQQTSQANDFQLSSVEHVNTGNVKVAVMQVVPGEHTFLSFEQRLLAEHQKTWLSASSSTDDALLLSFHHARSQVKVDLLQRHGWLVVQVPLAEWGQNSSQEQRVQDMDARLKWTLGNRNAVSPENCALLENPQF
eukprot:1161671-Pelagomonas_calceolata.AAC.21